MPNAGHNSFCLRVHRDDAHFDHFSRCIHIGELCTSFAREKLFDVTLPPQKIIPGLAYGHYSLHIVKELDHEVLVRDPKDDRVSEKPNLGIRKGGQDGERSVQECFFGRQHNAIPLWIDCERLGCPR